MRAFGLNILLYVAGGALLLGGGGGWVLSGWRASGVEQSLRGRVAVLEQAQDVTRDRAEQWQTTLTALRAATDRCKADVRRLQELDQEAKALRVAERAKWFEKLDALRLERDAALAGPFPVDCKAKLAEILRRAPR